MRKFKNDYYHKRDKSESEYSERICNVMLRSRNETYNDNKKVFI